MYWYISIKNLPVNRLIYIGYKIMDIRPERSFLKWGLYIKSPTLGRKFWCLGVAFLFLLSCGHSLTPKAYIKWMENPSNGFNKSRSLGPVIYTVQYKTPQYIMLKNNNLEKLEETNHAGIHYFGLTINPVDGKSQLLNLNLSSEQEYFARLQYFNFDFKNDIQLNINGHLMPCEYYFFESTGKITPGLTFTFGFDVKNETGDLQLVINDRAFGNGGLQFLFKEKTFNKIPQLKNNAS
jgi:hypothetical protein